MHCSNTAKEALKEEDKYTEESVKALKDAEKVVAEKRNTGKVKQQWKMLQEVWQKPAPEVNKDALSN